jgi:hypothetical protein
VRGAKRTIRFGTGTAIETPLLVPSISSRGFGFTKTDGDGVLSEAAGFMLAGARHLADRELLLSAYDIHYEYLADVAALREADTESPYRLPRVLFVDSGLYEWRRGPALGIPDAARPRDWNAQLLAETLDALDPRLAVIAVNYDRGGADTDGERVTFAEQISAAQRFFHDRHRSFGSDCLLKPERAREPFRVDALNDSTAAQLDAFSIVGVAEKDLGQTLIERLIVVSKLRDTLTRAGLDLPIHVFGALDPLYTPLYFAAGADIFDGLGWLRYHYHEDGVGMYKESPTVLEPKLFLNLRTDQRTAVMQQSNLGFMALLADRLVELAAQGEWRVFGQYGSMLDDVHRMVEAKI